MLYIVDTETTGLGTLDQVIEFARLSIPDNREEFLDLAPCLERIEVQKYKPSVPISEQASKVHGLYARDLWKFPPSSSLRLPTDLSCMIGHNISFDHRMLGKPAVSTICTLALAKRYFNKTKGVKLFETLQLCYGKEHGIIPGEFHSAGEDVLMCHMILRFFVQEFKTIAKVSELVKLCKQPKL